DDRAVRGFVAPGRFADHSRGLLRGGQGRRGQRTPAFFGDHPSAATALHRGRPVVPHGGRATHVRLRVRVRRALELVGHVVGVRATLPGGRTAVGLRQRDRKST